MNNKNKQEPISIEDAKKLFFDFGHESSGASVRTSIWESHWAHAQGATSKQQLINMLNNHKRLFDGKPSASGFVSDPDHSEERARIIKFLENRLKNEFGIVPERSNYKFHLTDQKTIDYSKCSTDELVKMEQSAYSEYYQLATAPFINPAKEALEPLENAIDKLETIREELRSRKPSLNEQIQSASARSAESHFSSDVKLKVSEPEL